MVNISSTELDPTIDIFFGKITTWSFTVYALISITGIIANGLLLLAIFKDPLKCFSTPTTYFIVNLAVLDLLNLAMCLNDILLTQTQYGSVYGLPKLAQNITFVLWHIIFNLTFPFVLSLALERCLALTRALWHKVRITSKVCRIWLLVVWLFNMVFALTCYFMYEYLNIAQTVFYGFFFLPPTLFVYIFAYFSIRRQYKAMATDHTMSEQVRRTINTRLKNQNRFLFTIFIINCILIFGLLPSLIKWVTRRLGQDFSVVLGGNSVTAVVLNVMDILFYINFAANPFIYYWRLPKYRKTFFAFFGCRR